VFCCVLAGLVDSPNVLFQVHFSIFFALFLVLLLARAWLVAFTTLVGTFANVALCSSFPVQAGQPSPYPPSMNTNLGGSRPSSQSAGPSTNPANGQPGNPDGQNGTPTFGNFSRFVSPPPNGANGSGFGSSDFGGAFSQQFPPQ
jgi:hypothetical protein